MTSVEIDPSIKVAEKKLFFAIHSEVARIVTRSIALAFPRPFSDFAYFRDNIFDEDEDDYLIYSPDIPDQLNFQTSFLPQHSDYSNLGEKRCALFTLPNTDPATCEELPESNYELVTNFNDRFDVKKDLSGLRASDYIDFGVIDENERLTLLRDLQVVQAFIPMALKDRFEPQIDPAT